jgi:hypothetical protein
LRSPGRKLRQGLVDRWDHVCARPRGGRPRAGPRHRPRRKDRPRQLDPDGRPREDVQGDGPVPAGAASEQPFDWGDEARVRELLGDDFDLVVEEHISPMRIASGEEYWRLFSTSYGPTKTLAEAIGERREELHRDWIDSLRRATAPTGRSSTRASTCSCPASAAEGSGGRGGLRQALPRPRRGRRRAGAARPRGPAPRRGSARSGSCGCRRCPSSGEAAPRPAARATRAASGAS